jgi:carboxyl-terminal processing protease
VREIVSNFANWGISRLIVDVRGNPGGYLNSAVDIADTFLPKGSEIVRIDYRREADVTEIAKRAGYNGKVAVLIDGNSASASEVLTAALKGRSNVKVFGVTSYGKGVIQEILRFPEGDGIKLTIAEYRGPDGIKIQDVGIVPDVIVENPKPDMSPYKNLAPLIYVKPLKSGDTGLTVFALQQRLSSLGYTVTPTGTFDSGTRSALMKFQLRQNLTVDGIFQEIVKKSIDRAIFQGYNQLMADKPLVRALEWLKTE